MVENRLPEPERNIGIDKGNYSENVGKNVYNIENKGGTITISESSNQTIKQKFKVPKLLPYLPNRKQQEKELDKLLTDVTHS